MHFYRYIFFTSDKRSVSVSKALYVTYIFNAFLHNISVVRYRSFCYKHIFSVSNCDVGFVALCSSACYYLLVPKCIQADNYM